MEKRGGGWGSEIYNYFIALVEMITTGFNISALKPKHATDDFIDELSQISNSGQWSEVYSRWDEVA